MSVICRRSWPNMLAITTIGGRIDRWDNGRPAHREQVRLMEALKFERSSRYLCSEAFITFISKPHDDDGSNSCALQRYDLRWLTTYMRTHQLMGAQMNAQVLRAKFATRETMKSTMKTQNRILAPSIATPATPPNPTAAAMSAI